MMFTFPDSVCCPGIFCAKDMLTGIFYCAITVLTQLIHIKQIVHKEVTELCESVRRKMKWLGN